MENKTKNKSDKKNEDKKKHFSLRTIIYNDKYLLVFSLILAVVVWTATSLSVGADETKTIKVNVPISLGDEVSEQLGMQYFSIKDSIDISVSITGAKYVVGQVTKDDLNIRFDTSGVTRTGDQSIPILVTNGSKTLDFSVQSVYPSSIEGYFDINTSKTFDVQVDYDESTVADGYFYGKPVLDKDKVVVTGPKTYIDKIERVFVAVDSEGKSEIKETISTSSKIQIEGSGVEERYLSISSSNEKENNIDSIAVTLPVLKVVELPVKVDIEDVPKGITDKDYSVSYSQKTIKGGMIDSAEINEAIIGTVSFSQLKTGRNEFNFTMDNLQGVTALESDTVITVTITISDDYVVQTVPLYKSSISLVGAEKGKEPTIKSINTGLVTVIVPRGTVINRSDLLLKCDVSDSENETVVIEASVNADKAWVSGTYTATIEY